MNTETANLSSLEGPVYNYLSIPMQPLGSSGTSYLASRHSGAPDWSAPNYFSGEVPSSTPRLSFDAYSGGEFLLPDGWSGETDSEAGDPELPNPSFEGSGACVSESQSPTLSTGSFTGSFHSAPSSSHSAPSSSVPTPRTTSELADIPMSSRGSKRRLGSMSSEKTRPVDLSLTMDSDKVSSGGGRGKGNKVQTSRRTKSTCRAFKSMSTKSPKEDIDEGSSLSMEKRRQRHSHNLVEKQYRNRLNSKFDRLLAALPVDQRIDSGKTRKKGSSSVGDGGDADHDAAIEEQRMSKAEILDLATKRIQTLEQEKRELQEECNELMQSVDVVTSIVANQRSGKMK